GPSRSLSASRLTSRSLLPISEPGPSPSTARTWAPPCWRAPPAASGGPPSRAAPPSAPAPAGGADGQAVRWGPGPPPAGVALLAGAGARTHRGFSIRPALCSTVPRRWHRLSGVSTAGRAAPRAGLSFSRLQLLRPRRVHTEGE